MRRFSGRVLVGVCFLAALSVGGWLRVRLLLGGSLGYDEGVYWQALRALHAGHGLFGSVYSSQPPAFLLLLSPLGRFVEHSVVPARLGVLAISLLGYAAAVMLVWRRFGRAAALLTLTLLAVDPLVVRESVTLQADGPATALGIASVALGEISWAARPRTARVVLVVAGAVLALAVMIKLFAFLFAIPLALVLAPHGGEGFRWRAFIARCTPALLAGVAVMATLLAPYAGVWSALWRQVVSGHLSGGDLGSVPGAVIRDEAPLMFLAALGIAFAVWRRPRDGALLGALAAPPVAFLLAYRPIFPHHLVLATMPLAVCAAPLVRPSKVRLAAYAGGVGAATVAASLLLISAAGIMGKSLHAEKAIARSLAAVIPAHDLLITDDQYTAALADRSTPPQLVDTSNVRIETRELTSTEVEHIARTTHVAAFVFATDRLALLPGLQTWVSQRFSHQLILPDGSTIYRK